MYLQKSARQLMRDPCHIDTNHVIIKLPRVVSRPAALGRIYNVHCKYQLFKFLKMMGICDKIVRDLHVRGHSSVT